MRHNSIGSEQQSINRTIKNCGIILTICIVAVVICGLIVIGIHIYELYICERNSNLNYKEIPTTAIVCELKRENGKINAVGHFMYPILGSREYNIYLIHEGEKYCINNEERFKQLNEGDYVDVILHEGYDDKGEILNRYLTFAQ